METGNSGPALIQDSPRLRVVRGLRDDVATGRLARQDRIPAESRLAHRFGVCRSTIRAALTELERQGVLARQPHRGFRVQPQAEPGGLMNQTVAVFSALENDPRPNLFAGNDEAVESGVVDSLRAAGLNALVLHPSMAHPAGVARVARSRPFGAVVTVPASETTDRTTLFADLASSGVPLAFYGNDAELAAFDRVASDHEAGTAGLVERLAAAGRRRILRLWTVPASVSWVQAHNAGYERTVARCGLRSLPAAYAPGIPFRQIGDRQSFDQRVRHFAGFLAEHLVARQPVDAIMVVTDSETFPLAAACRLLGRHPGDDVLVAGYDNDWKDAPERAWEPAIPWATVDKHTHLLGENLISLLLERAHGQLPEAPQCRLFAPEILQPDPGSRPRRNARSPRTP